MVRMKKRVVPLTLSALVLARRSTALRNGGGVGRRLRDGKTRMASTFTLFILALHTMRLAQAPKRTAQGAPRASTRRAGPGPCAGKAWRGGARPGGGGEERTAPQPRSTPLVLNLLAAAAVALSSLPTPAAAAAEPLPSVIDRARLVPEGSEARLTSRIADLQARTGWRVRLLTSFPDDAGAPSPEQLRAGWELSDGRAVAILADPSAPNMLRFFPGDAVLSSTLPRRFFIELQARFGNQFERRKGGGDPEALKGALDALLSCLEPEAACGGAVPGLAQEQRSLTTITSAAGGFVFGFASRAGVILPLAPLWAPLLAVYGLAPLLTRLPLEEAAVPVALNLAAFAGAALLFRASPLFQRAGAARGSITKEGQAERLRTEDEEE